MLMILEPTSTPSCQLHIMLQGNFAAASLNHQATSQERCLARGNDSDSVMILPELNQQLMAAKLCIPMILPMIS